MPASGRVHHEVVIGVYLTPAELHALDTARAALHYRHRIRADRSRIIREAIHAALNNLAQHGDKSMLVQALKPKPKT
jgi:hypothetical protein